ncbi:MAG TPA: SDR family oxidoreductase [Aestuariivirgaceae bacterium]|nr:SDR family oxidoreductase [Aestuariivirgaceae bacterium]
MDLGLKQKKALVTGGSQGLGLAIASALAAEGCDVAIGARGQERLDQAAAAIRKHGGKVATIVTDFSNENGCHSFVDKAIEALSGCDILINNVGGMIPGTLESFTDQQWRDTIDRNLMSYVHTTKHAIPHLKKSKAGRVLNISGISGKQLFPGAWSTSLPNAAIIAFNKLCANDLAPAKILVNNLSPGMINTEGWGPRSEAMAKARGTTPDQIRATFAATAMLNRWGEPHEIGAIAAFLVSEQNSFMTGATIECDGGAAKYI